MNMIVRRLAKTMADTRAFSLLLDRVERLQRGRRNVLTVLTYHRVDWFDASPSLDPDLISATPEVFEQQMHWLKEHCHILSIQDVLNLIRSRKTLPPRSVLITFDDAYRDFALHAWPVLKRYGLPAALFVPTNYPDQPKRAFWWDRLYQATHCTHTHASVDTPLGCLPLGSLAERDRAYAQLNVYVKTLPHARAMQEIDELCQQLGGRNPENSVMGWDELRQVASDGVTLGAHTQTHPLLNRLPLNEARAEVIGSLDDLKREIGDILPIFAYPGGGWSQQLIHMLANEGIELAFTTLDGGNDLRAVEMCKLYRINVGISTNLPVLRTKILLSHYFTTLSSEG